jgi:hypothetical protein
MSDPFADIRPYHDSEVAPVIARLLGDPEFLETLAKLRQPKLTARFPGVMRFLVSFLLRRELRDVKDVYGVQTLVKRYMDRMIESNTDRFSVSGLAELDTGRQYLFMSNHRDIALDPAFVNYALYHNEHDTVRIAIGDNLLSKPFVADLMRLNKSFIVKRSAKGPRQMLAAYKNLSAYIRHSIEVDNNSVWIAQREGRAKDGLDRTEPAIIKMLTMAQDKATESFSEFVDHLDILPVAISYEYDPCDGAKARELYEKSVQGSYQKAEHEDLKSIALGISGRKGDVHVSFGTLVSGEFSGPDAVAEAVDRQVIALYKLHPTNFFAYQKLHGNFPQLPCGFDDVPFRAADYPEIEREFEQRIVALPEPHRPFALGIYANPIVSKLEYANRTERVDAAC